MINTDVFLPTGLSWYPSDTERLFIVATTPVPDQPDSPLLRFIPLNTITTHKQLVQAMSQLYLWRDTEGRQRWPKWPFTGTGGRRHAEGGTRLPSNIEDLPKGVTVTAYKATQPGRTSPAIRVIAYWQDMTKPLKNGAHKQCYKVWQLPLGSTVVEVRKKVMVAQLYRADREREQLALKGSEGAGQIATPAQVQGP